MFHAGVLESKPTTDSLLPDISFQLNYQIYGIRVYNIYKFQKIQNGILCLKMDGWNSMVVSFWVWAYFQVLWPVDWWNHWNVFEVVWNKSFISRCGMGIFVCFFWGGRRGEVWTLVGEVGWGWIMESLRLWVKLCAWLRVSLVNQRMTNFPLPKFTSKWLTR